MLHRYSEVYPIHFSVAAELTGAFTPSQLRAALAAVQLRHPFLRVHMEDHPGARIGFYQPAIVPAIPLAMFEASDGHTWQQLAATKVSLRFDPRVAPLVRAVLLRQGPTAATLLPARANARLLGQKSLLRPRPFPISCPCFRPSWPLT